MFQIEVPARRLMATRPRLLARQLFWMCVFLGMMFASQFHQHWGQEWTALDLRHAKMLAIGASILIILSSLAVWFLPWHMRAARIDLYRDRLFSQLFWRMGTIPLDRVDLSRSRTPGTLESWIGKWSFRDSAGRSLARFPRLLYRRQDLESFFEAIEELQKSAG